MTDRQASSGVLLRMVLILLGVNLLLWTVPEAVESVRDWYKERQVNRALAFYERWSGERTLEDGTLEAETVGEREPVALPALLYRPTVPDDRLLPLVICLHGSGQRGDDLRGAAHFIGTALVEPSWQQVQPCFVLAPQCPLEHRWNGQSPYPMLRVLDRMLDRLLATHPIDPGRVYVVGFSMGAFGCWSWAAHAPERFAAMLAVAGGGETEVAARMSCLPIWAVHGSDDSTVPLERSASMVNAVNAAGGNAKLTELVGVGHDSWRPVRRMPSEYFQWLFEQARGDCEERRVSQAQG